MFSLFLSLFLLASSILRQLDEAVNEAADQEDHHNTFAAGLPAADILEWGQQLTAWHHDHSKFNPFETTFKGRN